jgi:hypothetical protein
MGALIGFLATMFGAGLTEFAARKREKRAQDLDWNRRLFDKYADAYRDFLAGWGGAGNAELLQRNFQKLQTKALVPHSLIQDYKEALASIREAASDQERAEAAKQLEVSIDSRLNDPRGLIKG